MIYTPKNTVCIGKKVVVYLNGKKVDDAFYADTDLGLIRSYIRGNDGVLTSSNGEHDVKEMYGAVEVKFISGGK